jgi:protein-disulfide isomerase
MIAFSDFECPYCARFANESLPWIKDKYIDTGQAARPLQPARRRARD